VADTFAAIPDRDLFKASEVCEIASVQPYVLRSWELEFPSLGTARSAGAPRVYRRADVERVLRIKELVYVEGLTLSGARRRIEDEGPAADAGSGIPAVEVETRQKLDGIKQELRALLDLLGGAPPPRQQAVWPPAAQPTLLEFDVDASRSGGKTSGNGRRAGGKKRGSHNP
jgi:DNA-binding transcriptional MerR regulator